MNAVFVYCRKLYGVAPLLLSLVASPVFAESGNLFPDPVVDSDVENGSLIEALDYGAPEHALMGYHSTYAPQSGSGPLCESGCSDLGCAGGGADSLCGGFGEFCCLKSNVWDGAFDLGVSGAAGNSENLNALVGLNMTRDLRGGKFLFDFNYWYARNENATTVDKIISFTRYERSFARNPNFGWYADGWFTYDRFTDFDSRVAAHGGIFAWLLKSEATSLQGRVGVGAVREFGAVDETWMQELQLGLDFVHQITKKQKFYATLDYFPDLDEGSQFRLFFDVGYEILLDESCDLALKIGVLDIYDSNPGVGFKRNDIQYGLALHWGF